MGVFQVPEEFRGRGQDGGKRVRGRKGGNRMWNIVDFCGGAVSCLVLGGFGTNLPTKWS